MKKILLTVLIVSFCIAMTACSAKTTGTPKDDSSEISTETTSKTSEESKSSSSYSYNSKSSESSKDESSLSYKSTTKKKKTCIACNGSGIIKQYATNDPWDEGYYMECVACHGKGYYYDLNP